MGDNFSVGRRGLELGSNDASLVALGDGWLVGWLVGWMVGWLVGCWVDCETSRWGKPSANDAQGKDAELCKTPYK